MFRCVKQGYIVSSYSITKTAFSQEMVENFAEGRDGGRGEEEGISRKKNCTKGEQKRKRGTLEDDSFI